MVRLLVVTESLEVGGAERQALQVIRRLPSDRIAVELALLGDGGPLETELSRMDIPYHKLGSPNWLDPKRLRELARILREGDFDAVEGLLHFSSMYACLAGRMAKTPLRIACNIGDRSIYSSDLRALKQRVMKRIAYGSATRIFVNSHYMAEADSILQPYRDKVRVIHNGLAEDAFATPADAEGLRKELGVPEQSEVLAMCGRLSAGKDYPTFLRVVQSSLSRGADVHGIVIGDGVERPALEALADQLSLADRVHFVGMVSDPRPYLAAADVFVFTSLRESLPNAVLEAMALGLPVVAVSTAGVPELVEQDVTGSLHQAGDVQSISETVLRLFGDEELRRRWGEAGRRRARERFHWDSRIADYEALFTP